QAEYNALEERMNVLDAQLDEEIARETAQEPTPALRPALRATAKGPAKAKEKAKYCFAFRRGQVCKDGDQCPYPHTKKEPPEALSLTESSYAYGDVMAVTRAKPKPREWTRIDATIDSGSACTCVPYDMVPEGAKIEPCYDGPQAYTSASDHAVVVVGKIFPMCKFQNGMIAPVEMKVLKGLKRPLFSVHRMVENGNFEVTHKRGESYATLKGKRFSIYGRNGVYVMPVWVDSAFLGRGQPRTAA
ncbi:hypothetical protein, partial [uncultured Marinobacter sp.]|uniref:hypothetical protein n=1 Tax=uncultured Marinobacter sp. TaxID=187379 RepID=UPI0025963994